MNLVAGLVTTSLVFWAGVWAASFAAIALGAWAGLYACCIGAGLAMWHALATRRAVWWLKLAGYAILGAAIFYGANQGLDALKGAHRKKPDVAASLGGLELWFVLAPGLVSIALGGWTASVSAPRD